MKVLQIYDCDAVNCGIMSVILEWNRQLVKTDIHFDYLFSYHKEDFYATEITKLGGKVFYMEKGNRINNFSQFVKEVKIFMKLHKNEYSIVHLHTTTFSFPYLYYAKKYNIQIRIAHAHSIAFGNSKFNSIRNRLLIWPIKYLANYFLACSTLAGQAWFKNRGINNYNIILNGIDTTKYQYDDEKRKKIREELNLNEEDVAVIHISNMTKIKNVPFVLKTFNQMLKKNKRCVLYLAGRNELPKNVVQAIEEYKLVNYVVNLGIRKDISDLLQAMDVCLMPSKSEGLGIVAVEAQAAGVPVIVSKGFPKDVIVTSKIDVIDFDCKIWADVALEKSKERKNIYDVEKLKKQFDSSIIAKKMYGFYYKCEKSIYQ